MAEESEKRFHSIMDKLFHASSSNSPSSPSGIQLSRGKKRPNPSAGLALFEPKSRSDLVEASQHSSASARTYDAPLCRPWDRGDLMRRLATFKSMTWFAKPKVVSAVNCARRGWVNVDVDIIACEACGARLLFSTPSSWGQQQVEKAALVFSLKLDNGHKLHCPWIDNACDETLAQFPPTPSPALVAKFRERCSAIERLLALPVVSYSALEYMSPQVEQFLENSVMTRFGDGSTNNSEPEFLGIEQEVGCVKSYYQTQLLLALCGWKPRSLPYVVDSKERSQAIVNGQSHSVGLQSLSTDENMEDGGTETSSELQFDPNSVVLDCTLCGASVGLWAFHTVSRPIELVRLVGYTDVNSEKEPVIHASGDENQSCNQAGGNSPMAPNEGASNLKFSIAGGPPPTRQNFKATISFPVIGKNLRARFSNILKDRLVTQLNQDDVQSSSHDANLFHEGRCLTETSRNGLTSEPELPRVLGSEGHDIGSNGTADVEFLALCRNGSGEVATLEKESDKNLSLEGENVAEHGTFPESEPHVSGKETSEKTTENDVQEFVKNGELCENSGSLVVDNMTVPDPCSSQVSRNILNSHGTSTEENSSDSNGNLDSGVQIGDKEGKPSTDDQAMEGEQASRKEEDGVKEKVLAPVSCDLVACSRDNRSKKASSDKGMEFDPIRQHRHFCPWIASSGNAAPGWQQTLTALQKEKGFSSPSPKKSPSSSIIKVDDPIKSVRTLFTSSAKKLKRSLSTSQNVKH